MNRMIAAAALALAMLYGTGAASAQSYPARSIQVIVPFAAAARAT